MWVIRLSPRELLLEDPSFVSQLATAQAGGQWPRSADGANQYQLEGWEGAPVAALQTLSSPGGSCQSHW